uniref:D-alanine--D-alanine ligase n=1 Tax=uncultured bacterium contig00023(2014) TaxID=1465628 RepID=A0A060D1D2_9BACT|nr:D-alanine-D-alanine ligase [uncultured bacterium contig00023(2014)]
MKTKVGVFFGGRSVEHEISVISALQAIAALDAGRYDAVPIYITKQGRWLTGEVLLDSANYRDMAALARRATEVWMKPEYGDHRLYRKGRLGRTQVVAQFDVALPVLHGTNGEDGTFQGLMELIGIPYVGCNVLSSAVGMDKIAMKMMLRESGIPVIDYVWFTDRQWGTERDDLVARIEEKIGYPVIVKPANLGSSVGISRARGHAELVRAVGEAIGYSSRIIVERMIDPLREINCSVCGSADDHRASVCEEPLRSGEILSYADKYMSGGGTGTKNGGTKMSGAAGAKSGTASGGMSSTKRRIPADLPETVSEEIRRLAAETFRVLGCEGVARVDFILDGAEVVYVNEINTIPGSLSFYLWEATGLSFDKLMDTLIAQALKRERDKGHKTVSYDQNIFAYTGAAGAKGGTKFSGKK